MGGAPPGELFERYGRDQIEAAFDAILDATTETYRREILAKIPDGTYVWEDYAEHDGVDEPMLHTQRITLTKVSDAPADPEQGRPAGPRLIIDFTGTAPQAKGPINHCGDYVGGNFLKVARPIQQPRRHPRSGWPSSTSEGIVPLIEMRFPGGHLLTRSTPAPRTPGPSSSSASGVLAGVVAKAVDGRMPADQETIAGTGVYGHDRDGGDYLMRGRSPVAARVALLRRRRGHHPRRPRLPQPADRVHRGRFRSSSSASASPWIPVARPLPGRTGLREAHPNAQDAHFMSIADRSILACWGVRGGKAGAPFQVTIDPGGPEEREIDALADAEPIRAGQVVRIRTTGGGGWGDPLERPYPEVERDLRWGRCPSRVRGRHTASSRAARDEPVIDREASDALREDLRAGRGQDSLLRPWTGYATLGPVCGGERVRLRLTRVFAQVACVEADPLR